MGALMGTPLSLLLLFCLFSFLFGVFAVLYTEALRALFTASGLLPSKESRRHRISSLCRMRAQGKAKPPKAEAKKEKPSPLHVVGYLLYDLLFWLSLSVFYAVFLYEANGGIFRLYSLLLDLCGFLLFKGLAVRLFARPFFLVLSFALSFVGLFLRFPLWSFLAFFRRATRKKPKQLDENAEMV